MSLKYGANRSTDRTLRDGWVRVQHWDRETLDWVFRSSIIDERHLYTGYCIDRCRVVSLLSVQQHRCLEGG